MPETQQILAEMNDRSREIFRRVVEGYLASGEPIGSRSLSRLLPEKISAATIRNVMQDLEFLGLIGSPHISAGRVPTERGLRMFVDGLMEVGDLPPQERAQIEASLRPGNGAEELTTTLDRVGAALSAMTRGASLVLAPKYDAPIKHLEFVSLAPDRALVVLVFADGHVENRLFKPPPGLTPSALREAANFLSALAEGRSLTELKARVSADMAARRQEIDRLAQQLVESGLAVWEAPGEMAERLIVRGRAHLLEDAASHPDLERVKQLFDDLERSRDLADFLELTESGEGVRIFIGAENKLFSLSGSSLVVAPYMNADRKIVGAVGVIGPTRLNYGRIVPIVDYTAQLMGRLMTERGKG